MNAEDIATVSRYNPVIDRARANFQAESIIEKTFNLAIESLPSVDWLTTIIETDQEHWKKTEGYSLDRSMGTSTIRSEYVKRSFPILTDEFIRDVVAVIRQLRALNVAEMCAGTGWLSHWLRIYGLEIQAVIDNKSWPGFEGRYLPLVEAGDSVEYVQAHPEADLFILSWPPYAGDVAAQVWKAMREGAYLLYVGESSGGCTGDDEFFGLLPETAPETEQLQRQFISFSSIHDRPELYRKEA